jgi:hypothetical protein
LKVSYCVVVLYHWVTGEIPSLWIPMAWIDLVFLILFFLGWRKVGTVNKAAV